MKCLYPLICVYNSENRSEMNQQIHELRYYDCAKQMTLPDGPAVLSNAACDGLINLLEVMTFESFLILSSSLKQGADMANTPNYVKFYCRTFFLGIVRDLGDAITEDMMSSSIKSSLYRAYEVCSNPEQFDAFLFSEANSELLPYYLSAQHQQMQGHISELTGLNFVMSTPYEFAAVVNSYLHIPNFERTIGYIIDFALTIPATFQLTSEEIFVGSCLVFWQQHNSEGLGQLLINYFQPSLPTGSLLKGVITEELLQSLNGEA